MLAYFLFTGESRTVECPYFTPGVRNITLSSEDIPYARIGLDSLAVLETDV